MSPMERAGFAAHARSARFERRLDETRAFLVEVLPERSAHCSISGGKDSSLCWHLALEARPGISAAHFDSGGEHPASGEFVRTLAERLDAPLYVYHPRLSYPELLRMAYKDDVYVSSASLMRFIIDEPAERAARELDSDAYVIGLRREESPGRDKSGLFHGPFYRPKGGGPTRIAPLLKWTARDVWAATVSFDLPVHPAYAERLQGESIEKGRVGVLADLMAGHSAATLARFKERNPAGYAALKASAPEAPWPH